MIALNKYEGQIRMRDSETKAESCFDAVTGQKVWGNLEMAPENVLFRAWKQTQNPSLSEKQLREKYAQQKVP